MGDEDAELFALIDNELDPDARSRLLARLEEDVALGKRYQRFQETDGLVARALDDLEKSAPLDRLRAAIPKAETSPIVRWRSGRTVLPFAAGIVVGFLAAGIVAWATLTFAPQEEREDWRTAVVEYMQLYTNETFALEDAALSFQEKKLSAIGEKLKLRLVPETLAIPGLRFRAAQPVSRDRLRELPRGARAVLHHLWRRTRFADAIGNPWRPLANFVGEPRPGLFGDRAPDRS